MDRGGGRLGFRGSGGLSAEDGFTGGDGAGREVPGEADSDSPRDLLILAQGDSWETRFQVTSLAATALASGSRVTLALFFAALDSWVGGRWDGSEPRGTVEADRLAALDLPPLSSMLRSAAPSGDLRVLACSASTRILGLDREAVQGAVDAIVGWPTFHRLMGGAGRTVTF